MSISPSINSMLIRFILQNNSVSLINNIIISNKVKYFTYIFVTDRCHWFRALRRQILHFLSIFLVLRGSRYKLWAQKQIDDFFPALLRAQVRNSIESTIQIIRISRIIFLEMRMPNILSLWISFAHLRIQSSHNSFRFWMPIDIIVILKQKLLV